MLMERVSGGQCWLSCAELLDRTKQSLVLLFSGRERLDKPRDDGWWKQDLNQRRQSHNSAISVLNLFCGWLSRGKSKSDLKFMLGRTNLGIVGVDRLATIF